MPSSADLPDALVDTSVAVALVVEAHEHHTEVLAVVEGLVLGLAGHAAFETFSVLTRLPAPVRRTPAVVHEILEANFPRSQFLSAAAAATLRARLAEANVAGNAVYDALVGAVAVEHRLPIVTRDDRAIDVYRALGVELFTP